MEFHEFVSFRQVQEASRMWDAMRTPSSDLIINFNEERIMNCMQFLGQNLTIPVKLQFKIRDNSL